MDALDNPAEGSGSAEVEFISLHHRLTVARARR